MWTSAKTINVSSVDDSTKTSEEILELANGCLCCSIKDSGVAAIEKLMQRKGAFDHILLETTGLADPGVQTLVKRYIIPCTYSPVLGPIASLFWQNEEFSAGLGQYIHLDGVVCMVDAVFGRQVCTGSLQMQTLLTICAANGRRSLCRRYWREPKVCLSLVGLLCSYLTASDHWLRQIACADVVLLSKIDLVSPEQAADIERLIAQVNPAAIIHRTVRGNIDLKQIMGIDAYASKSKSLISGHLSRTEQDPSECHNASCQDSHHKHPHHYELRGISSLQVFVPVLSQEAFDRLDEWIRTLLWESRIPEDLATAPQPITVLRCKGIFQTSAGATYVLQGVRSLYEISPAVDESNFGLEAGKLVFIGKGLNERIRGSLSRVLGE